MSQLFGSAFARQCAAGSGKVAVIEGMEHLDYDDLDRRARVLAQALLAQGLTTGDLVAGLHDAAIPSVMLFLACQYAGLGFVPLNPGLVADEVARVAVRAGIALTVAAPGSAGLAPGPVLVLSEAATQGGVRGAEALLRWVERVSPQEILPALPGCIPDSAPALVICSSGSMGAPKCVQISRAGYRRQILRQAQAGGVRSDDIFQLVLPLHHAAGLIGVLGVSFVSGASVVARMGRFRPEPVLAHLRATNATITHWIPTMISRMTEYFEGQEIPEGGADLGQLRAVHFGSMHLSDALRDRAITWFPGLLWQSYGSTECGFVAYLEPADLEARDGRTGRFVPGSGPRIVDPSGRDVAPGEIGEMVMPCDCAAMTAYLGEPERTRQVIRGGMVHSGDVARNDADGYFTILGRKDGVIVTGGLKVYPSEVEFCVEQRLGGAEVAVIGLPDAEFGERVCVVLTEHWCALSAAELRELCRPHMASYKLPRRLEFVDEMPRTATGKVAYGELRRRFGAGQMPLLETEHSVHTII